MKRIALFVLTNLAILVVLGVLQACWASTTTFRRRDESRHAARFAAVVGFTGSIFSLLISKWMAKWTTARR